MYKPFYASIVYNYEECWMYLILLEKNKTIDYVLQCKIIYSNMMCFKPGLQWLNCNWDMHLVVEIQFIAVELLTQQ